MAAGRFIAPGHAAGLRKAHGLAHFRRAGRADVFTLETGASIADRSSSAHQTGIGHPLHPRLAAEPGKGAGMRAIGLGTRTRGQGGAAILRLDAGRSAKAEHRRIGIVRHQFHAPVARPALFRRIVGDRPIKAVALGDKRGGAGAGGFEPVRDRACPQQRELLVVNTSSDIVGVALDRPFATQSADGIARRDEGRQAVGSQAGAVEVEEYAVKRNAACFHDGGDEILAGQRAAWRCGRSRLRRICRLPIGIADETGNHATREKGIGCDVLQPAGVAAFAFRNVGEGRAKRCIEALGAAFLRICSVSWAMSLPGRSVSCS